MALKKITGNETPRPLRGKTNKFSRQVRFVDLNESLKEIEENFIQLPANPSNGDALVFNGTEWVPGSVGGEDLNGTLVAGNETGGENIVVSSGDTIDADSGGGQLNLRYSDTDANVLLSNDGGAYNADEQLYLSPGYVELSSYAANGIVGIFGGGIQVRVGTTLGYDFTVGDGITATLAVLDNDVFMPNLPEYADNAAAVLGGLAVDGVYKTATGELRIVV